MKVVMLCGKVEQVVAFFWVGVSSLFAHAVFMAKKKKQRQVEVQVVLVGLYTTGAKYDII